ncbi:MAG TPA: Ada metal-binding domain-containing protein [Pyrinomonadaceae bacterium]|jgi:predicted Ser/Thr protein kinase
MQAPTTNFWPTARHYAEAVQCPAVCFAEPSLKGMPAAVDRLGMPLVTSGQFAYVFKLNPAGAGEALAVRCFRGFLGDREERYRALDAHLGAHHIAALPRFRYLPQGVLVAGRRYPLLVMEWVEGPTLDVYLDEAVGRRDALLHLAGEWVRLVAALREAGIAHGDLQHGNIIVERGGRLRLVDLDGMYVPALEGFRASEVGHQHYQHPARDPAHFSRDTDNFSALVVYLSLVSLAERPELWGEHHDENLIFTRADFADPDASALFRKIEAMGGEHARLAAALKAACRARPSETPPLTELVSVAPATLPGWMTAPAEVEVRGRTREVSRDVLREPEPERLWASRHRRPTPNTPASATVQGLFNSSAGAAPAAVVRDPADVGGNTLFYAKNVFGNSYGYIWWIPLHNFWLQNFWGAFGVTDTLAGMLLTFVLLSALLLVYGFVRALKEAQAASGAPAAAGAGGGGPAARAFRTPHAATPLPAPAPASLFGPAPAQTPAAPKQSTPDPLPAMKQVVGNSSLGIYHLPGCEWVARIARRQRADFDSPDAARAAHFRPCRVCQP